MVNSIRTTSHGNEPRVLLLPGAPRPFVIRQGSSYSAYTAHELALVYGPERAAAMLDNMTVWTVAEGGV